MPTRSITDLSAWTEDVGTSLELVCSVASPLREFMGVLTDLSYGGACIRLAVEDLPDVPKDLRYLKADPIGDIAIVVRWQRGDMIGVSFRSEDAARPGIEAFFRDRGGAP